MAQKPVTISNFAGMNNVDRVSPIRVIHNMKITTDKKLVKREGYTLWKRLLGVHSLRYIHEEGAFLCAATGTTSPESLYRVTLNGEAEEICPITGLGEQLYFIPLQGRVYISSRTWNGIYEGGTVRAWGQTFGDDPAALENASTSEEMMTLTVTGAPCMENLCLGGSRIFGNVGSRIYYNDPPLAYEMFRPDAFHQCEGEIVMIASEGRGGLYAKEGFYIATTTDTWFAAGYDPEEWDFTRVGEGALPGSLQYLPTLKLYSNVPVWIARTGVVAGVGGTLQQLTKNKVTFDATGRAASFYRQQGGGQYLTSFIQPPDVGFGDAVTCEVVRAGKLIT